jgi:tRNA dimethylallyltransferase
MGEQLLNTHVPLFLLGATGVGKSAAAMELARAWSARGVGAAILCLDAMQVYRGADIGTGKPTAAERGEYPHGGLDLVDFGARFDVAHYLAHAAEFLRAQREAGRRVIVVGGTGLYFRALTRGLCDAPQGSEDLRAELAGVGTEELRARLERVDPGMLTQIDAKNPRRLARAIEVMEATGKSLREWQDATPEPLVRDFTALWLQRERDDLHARIAKRVEQMFAQGWEEEVRGLIARHGIEKVVAFPGIGYREIAEYRSGSGRRLTLPELKRDILVATRQYAKRQLTWFAREPKVSPVMLTGHPSFSAALRAACLPDLF